MNKKQKSKRNYRRITPSLIALHQAQAVISGNNTRALEAVEDTSTRTYKAVRERASRIVAKRDGVTAAQYIEDQLEQIGAEAVERVGELVHSEDERIATKNAHYVIDHIRGKAIQRNISVTGRLNIQSVLD